MKNTAILILVGLFAAAASTGCAASKGALQVSMEPLQLGKPVAQAKTLEKNHFKRDHAGSISEEDLRKVLNAPVFLEADSRLGVVPVATCYEPDPDLPLAVVPQELSRAMEDSGLFEVTTEVSTDWPADRGISGLRELAARNRSEYLLLYRHRFVDRSYTNDWGWLYITVLGVLFAPLADFRERRRPGGHPLRRQDRHAALHRFRTRTCRVQRDCLPQRPQAPPDEAKAQWPE